MSPGTRNTISVPLPGELAARTRGLAAYKDLLALWKDADSDSDVPILKEAKAGYAKLQ